MPRHKCIKASDTDYINVENPNTTEICYFKN